MNWDQFFMTMVYLTAMKSKDESTKIGAVIVDIENTILSLGFNGLPRRVNDRIEEPDWPDVHYMKEVPELKQRHQAPEKYYWYEHAERNAIYNTARYGGVDLRGSIMYTQGLPCSDCARGIIQSGISTVVIHKKWMDSSMFINNDKWSESAKRTDRMFTESGVTVKIYDGPIITEIVGLSNRERIL